MKCHICNKELSKKGVVHIYKCDKREKSLVKYNYIIYNNSHINWFDFKEQLQDLYINKGYSTVEISTICNLIYSHITFLLTYYNIPIRNIRQSKTERVKEKYKSTCIEKFGVENVSQLQDIKDKKAATSIKNYGVDNIRKSQTFKDNYKEKMQRKYGKGSLPNKYGGMNKFWDNQTSEYKKQHTIPAYTKSSKNWYNLSEEEKQIITRKKFKTKSSSSLEKRFSNILNKYNIRHKKQKWITNKRYDIHISNSNILVEINGDFWHANPIMYLPDDIVCIFKTGEKRIASDIWKQDLQKKLLAEKYGYSIIYLWESEFKTCTDEELFNKFINMVDSMQE